ncbi:MAG: hypothetical protein ACIAQF_07510 [Phycisphaerales bacterium JB065]
MSVADLLRDLAKADCSILIDGDLIELLGGFPDDLLARAKARRLCIRAILLGGLSAGRGPMFGPDDLAELANAVADEDRVILEHRWVVVRPSDYSDWREPKNRPKYRPCYALGVSEGAETVRTEDAPEGLYGPATGALAHKRIEWKQKG